MVGTSEDLMDEDLVLTGKSCLSLRRQSYFSSPRNTIATVPFLRPKKKRKKKTNQNHLLPKELNAISESNRNTPGMLSQGHSQGLGEEVISAPHAWPVPAIAAGPACSQTDEMVCCSQDSRGRDSKPLADAHPHGYIPQQPSDQSTPPVWVYFHVKRFRETEAISNELSLPSSVST